MTAVLSKVFHGIRYAIGAFFAIIAALFLCLAAMFSAQAVDDVMTKIMDDEKPQSRSPSP